MTALNADFVLVGSTPLALVLSGLLAGEHGRRVVLVRGERPSLRLPRGIDLSLAPMTRPESWKMLTAGVPELLKLAKAIAGRRAITRVDPIFFSHDPPAIEALSHMRQMALAMGIAAEPLPLPLLGEGRCGIVLRDAALLNHAIFDTHVIRWLQRVGVQLMAPDAMDIVQGGNAVLRVGDKEHHARQTILADDAAILSHLPESQWPSLLVRSPAATILATSSASLAAAIMTEIHSGLTLMKQAEGGIAALAAETMPKLSSRLQGFLRKGPVEQVGQTQFTKILTKDGAPAVGRINGSDVDIVAGLGPTGLFFAPALARWLCGKAAPNENQWFGARLVSRQSTDASVTEYAPTIMDWAA